MMYFVCAACVSVLFFCTVCLIAFLLLRALCDMCTVYMSAFFLFSVCVIVFFLFARALYMGVLGV